MEARGRRHGRGHRKAFQNHRAASSVGKPVSELSSILSSIRQSSSAQGLRGLIGSLCKVKIMRHTREQQFIRFDLKTQVMNHVYPQMEVIRESGVG